MKMIKEPDGAYSNTFHGLSDRELKLILPAIKREYKHAVKMAEYYDDLVMDGYGTGRQTTARMKWQVKADILVCIINYAKNKLKL